MEKSKKTGKVLLSFLMAVSLFFIILTFSISLPILIRPFYYAHITPLELDDISGFTKQEIIDSYDEVLDYLTLPSKEFSAGVMKYSLDGADHFADCKNLFSLNFNVLFSAVTVLIIVLILKRKLEIEHLKLGKYNPCFYAGVSAVVLPLVIGFLAALNFEKAFEIFHKLFFKGKDNWTFNPVTDEIINVLPMEFFRNAAILIAVGILLISTVLIMVGIKTKKK